MMTYCRIGFLLVLLACSSAGAAEQAAATQPNILVIVVDDMGWADVGYHRSPIKTPHIDRLCKQGVELDQHYVAPMCTPTRTALLTGRYWSRFGNTSPSNTRVLPWNTVTLAGALKSVGYDTCITGKWHLGSLPKWGPRKFGFNHSHGALAGGVNPWSHLYKHGKYSRTWHRNDQLIEQQGHVTDLITQEAVRFIEKKRDSPFFVYVPYTAVHTPFDEPKEWLDAATQIGTDRRQYAASAQHMDDGVGQMIAALKRKNILDKTLVVLFSDNGGANGDDSPNYPDTVSTTKVQGLNSPLRGWKGSVYEGGIRTPALVSWPGHLQPGKVTAPLHVIDWMPTLCNLVGYKATRELKWDGQDIWPTLNGQDAESRVLYCQGVRFRSAAIRDGDLKLVKHVAKKGPDRLELFDLAADPNETTDLAAKRPKQVVRLAKLLAEEESRDNDAVPGNE